jgi:putative transposase
VYIDLNMVRARVIDHPSEWPFSGYSEIQEPRKRYALIDYQRLQSLVGIDTYELFKDAHRKWVEASLRNGNNVREQKWTESIAVGNKSFVDNIKHRLGMRAKGRKVLEAEDAYQLREPVASYGTGFASQNDALRFENGHLWNVYPETSG